MLICFSYLKLRARPRDEHRVICSTRHLVLAEAALACWWLRVMIARKRSGSGL